MMSKSYIYIRQSGAFDAINVFKLGKTNDLANRHIIYKLSEPLKGEFTDVFEFSDKEQLNMVERALIRHMRKKGLQYGNNRGFCNKFGLSLIENFLRRRVNNYRKLSKEEIEKAIRSPNNIDIETYIKNHIAEINSR